MAKALTLYMALALWQQGFIGALDLFSIKHHLPQEPSGVAWIFGQSTEVLHGVSSLTQCTSLCLAKACVGVVYEDNVCTMEGVGNSIGLTLVGQQLFQQWTVNYAYMKSAYGTTSRYPGANPSNAVDDNLCYYFLASTPECCFTTYQRTNAWLVVDLGFTMRVRVVAVASIRMRDSEVRVGQERKWGDFSTYELLGRFTPTARKGYIKYTKSSGVVGRYVSIQQIPYANFFVCDVVVLGDILN